MKVLYATDMDRTMIFSHRFIKEYPTKSKYSLVEEKDGKEISYMSDKVLQELHKLSLEDNLEIVPVTTRSIDEFKRINLGIKTAYAIVSNGGTILYNGEPLKEWEEYIKDNINRFDLISCALDMSELASVARESKFIDNKYVFNKTTDPELYDNEIGLLRGKYPNINFVRQKNKVYAVPKCFNKAIALRWLQHYTNSDTVVASGDSELDLPMLAIANYAIIPKHGDLINCGFVTDGRIISAGIDSPLETFSIIREILDNKK